MTRWPTGGGCVNREAREKASFPTFLLVRNKLLKEQVHQGLAFKGVRVPGCWKPSEIISCF